MQTGGGSGDTFVIVTADTVIGTFDTVTAPGHYRVIQDASYVEPQTQRSPDLNGDGLVNLADLALFQACYAGSGHPSFATCANGINADLDVDGDVDLHDFILLFAALNW